MGEHNGHRQRMKQRFLRYGLDNFQDHEILELLLFYAMPRVNTNSVAHRLMETFGTLDAVFDAAPEQLKNVEGVGDSAAALIRLVPEAARRYLMAKNDPGGMLLTTKDMGRYLLPRVMAYRNEVAYLVCMDAKMKVLDCRPLSEGSATSVSVNPRQVMQVALSMNASNVLLAHNHVSGIAVPSKEDIMVTLRLRDILAMVDVTLVDHIVLGGGDFVSMADSGYL